MATTMQLIGKTVPRIGYGTMRLPGDNIMGPPKDHNEAIRVLKRAVELGVKVMDTAWYYGPDVSNELVAEALRPYPDDLLFITKLGGARTDDGGWVPALKPDELRAGMERDLRLLKVDSIPIVHLRWMGDHNPGISFEEALETMLTLQSEGKFQHLGLSTVTMDELKLAQSKTTIATVSNQYGFDKRDDDPIVDYCAEQEIAYLPYFPLSVGKTVTDDKLTRAAEQLNITPTQLALAWLLKRSPTMLPIPGTSSVAHLEENVAAGDIDLSDDIYQELLG